MKISVYNSNGDKTKDIEISQRLFGVKPKTEVIHQVVVAQQANARRVLADTKDKSEVRGGGKKPWAQKGTGRARHGSSRSPIWVGGGVTFGPTSDRNFTKGINKKQKQLAMAMCLSDKVIDRSFLVFEKIELASGKTKDLKDWLESLKSKITDIKNGKKFLLVLDKNDDNLIRAVKNLDKVDVILADSLNCVDILNHDTMFASEKAVDKIDKHYKQVSVKRSQIKDKK
ncbi:MAG: 50S ribosomal protein L4 [Candidatus Buchananbacteria bacterium]|nr:50S ribosomal protein L4 [Candidatus Buchananbacteria bacterium]